MGAPNHPIHGIPNELLGKVFTAITQMSLKEWHESTSSPGVGWTLPFPMLASAVCQHWRYVALNTPELWSTIYIPMFITEKPRRALLFDPAKFTALWLALSKASLLHVFLSVPELALAFDLSADVILPKVLQNITRLRTLAVHGDLGSLAFPNVKGIFTAIATQTGWETSPLHALSLRFSGGGLNDTRITQAQFLLDRYWDLSDGRVPKFPSVQKLEVEGTRIDASFFPNLVSLTVFDLNSTVDEFHQVFQSLPHLSELTLHRLRVFMESADTPHPIIVPSLKYLSLSFVRRSFNSSLSYPAAIMRLPNLKTLQLDGQNSVPICSCLDSSFVSSIDNLQTLQLINFVRFGMDSQSHSTQIDTQLLHQFTSIRSLEVINSHIGELLVPYHTSSPPAGVRRNSLVAKREQFLAELTSGFSPNLAETSRTLEAAFNRMRINGRQEGEISHPMEGPLSQLTPGPVPVSSSSNTLNWPNLSVISIDCLAASDIVSLCKYVALNKEVKYVRLSGPARRHLSQSVKRRIADDTFFAATFIDARRYEWDMARAGKEGEAGPGVESGQEWIERRVQILPFEYTL